MFAGVGAGVTRAGAWSAIGAGGEEQPARVEDVKETKANKAMEEVAARTRRGGQIP